MTHGGSVAEKKSPEEQQQISTWCPHGNGKDNMGIVDATCWHCLMSTVTCPPTAGSKEQSSQTLPSLGLRRL